MTKSKTIEIKNLISTIKQEQKKKPKINRLPEQPGDVPLTCADISKAKRLLGYAPRTPFSQGLPRFVNWFLSSEASRVK
jgi:UDP-glucuronate 4-epimerase